MQLDGGAVDDIDVDALVNQREPLQHIREHLPVRVEDRHALAADRELILQLREHRAVELGDRELTAAQEHAPEACFRPSRPCRSGCPAGRGSRSCSS